jgi:tRNA U34 5-carboxymethylaminomethyl modifying GTPase MnmE/TrmE
MSEDMEEEFELEDEFELIDEEQLPDGHKSGFVAIVGRPNVGKSTLLNNFLQQKVAIVSPRPQTTRSRQLGILTRPEYQIIFVDTPGIMEPRHKLDEYMVESAMTALEEVDVVLWLVDASEPPGPGDEEIGARLRSLGDTTPRDPRYEQGRYGACGGCSAPLRGVPVAGAGRTVDSLLGDRGAGRRRTLCA